MRSHLRCRAALARVLVAGLIGLGLVWSACSNDCHLTPKGTYPNRETPQGLLDYFAKSLEDRNLRNYEECLWDSYRFFFAESDWTAAGVTSDQPYWDRTQDLASAEHMFTSSTVQGIYFDVHRVGDFTGSHTLLTAVCDPVINVTIEVHPGEEPITKQVRKSHLLFELRPDPENEHLWVIRQIQEELGGLRVRLAAATESTSFGSLKALFK